MLRLIVPVVIGLLFLAVIAGWFWYTTWLVRSAIDELAHRRRLLAGVDPLQVTATKVLASAEAAHDSAHRALSLTVEAWYDLRESRAVGTALVERFPRIEEGPRGTRSSWMSSRTPMPCSTRPGRGLIRSTSW